MVGWMRLALAAAALLTIFIDSAGMGNSSRYAWIALLGYFCYSLLIYVLSLHFHQSAQPRLVHWADAGWSACIVFFTGYESSLFFPFFFFAILTASFRWGFEEGARVTLVSAGLYAASALFASGDGEISRLLLRTTFLLGLGYMITYWGGSEVTQKGRLALLRNVCRMSNPRFGVDHTLASLLQKTCAHFKAANCILVMRSGESEQWSLRTAGKGGTVFSGRPQIITAATAQPLMSLRHDCVTLYCRPLLPLFSKSIRQNGGQLHDPLEARWKNQDSDKMAQLAELLEARSFISVSLCLRNGEGRFYVVSERDGFSKADALFLSDIATQAFAVIENIELVDHLASHAALRERERIARDLHDSTIQPYIGLKHGIDALRNRALDGNPLLPAIDRLSAMAAETISDLRTVAGALRAPALHSEPMSMKALRSQVRQVRDFYGVDIALSIEGAEDMNDRLAAEVFQIVSEGISNIRKHTDARSGVVRIFAADGALKITIDNECLSTAGPPASFTPRSICERVIDLGGKVDVQSRPGGSTTVRVSIPV